VRGWGGRITPFDFGPSLFWAQGPVQSDADPAGGEKETGHGIVVSRKKDERMKRRKLQGQGKQCR